MTNRTLRNAGALLLWLTPLASLQAHDSRPLYVEIVQHSEQQFSLHWKVPDSVAPGQRPQLRLSAECSNLQSTVPTSAGELGRAVPAAGQQRYRCPQRPSALQILYPLDNPSLATLLRVRWQDEPTSVLQAGPEQTELELNSPSSMGSVLLAYSLLGLRHIAGGYDHLLFVACLVLLARRLRPLILAVTGFTLGHSLTLAAATLGPLRIAVPPTEAAIALSIVCLAAELARGERPTLAWRAPVLIASLFGLLHGLGFASVLTEIGLPQGEIAAALLGFNLGVECGQLVFVLVLLVLLRLLWGSWPTSTQSESDAPERLRIRTRRVRLLAYPIGTAAAFWLAQRLSGLLL